MAPRTLPNLELKGFWDLGEDLWNDDMDLNLLTLSVLTQGVALSRVEELPETPVEGDVYIVPDGSGDDSNKIAVYDDGEWTLIEPKQGWSMYIIDDEENVQFDGTDWIVFVGGGGGSGDASQLNLSFFAGGILLNNETIFAYVSSRDFSLPAGLPLTSIKANVAATAETILTIKKNGSSIGTATFAAAGTTATLSFASEQTFDAGTDSLTLVGPASADDTLADVYGNFVGDVIN